MDSLGGETWRTYAELAAHWGCTRNAARVRVQRAGWLRRSPNRPGDCAAVLVPADALVRPGAAHMGKPDDIRVPLPNGAHDEAVRLLGAAVDSLTATIAAQQQTIAGQREEIRLLLELATRSWWRRWFR